MAGIKNVISLIGIPVMVSGTLLTADKHKVAYHHYRNGHNQVVIIAHGFYNSKEAILLQKLKNNLLDSYDVFMFDFRGHGKSSGLYSWTSKEERDLEAVFDYLKGRYEKTGMIAFSLGGSVAINVLAKRNDSDALICVSTPSDCDKIDYKFWKLDWKGDVWYTLISKEGRKGKGVRVGPFWFKKQKPIDNVGNLKIPILYIHGEKDWVVEPWHSQALYDKTNSKKKLVIIKNGPHAEYLMKESEGEFIKEIRQWFNQTLNGGAR